jgi:hypothetical protein
MAKSQKRSVGWRPCRRIGNPKDVRVEPGRKTREATVTIGKIWVIRSKGGRRFHLGPGKRCERYLDDSLWDESWPIYYGKLEVGTLWRDLNYGSGASGQPRYHASGRWHPVTDSWSLPTGLGFDVAAFDTSVEALVAWSHSADQVFDYEAGKRVPNIYSKTGYSQKKAA